MKGPSSDRSEFTSGSTSGSPPSNVRPWRKHGSRPGTEYRIFRSRFDDLENPRTGARMERVILETPDWVNVIAIVGAAPAGLLGPEHSLVTVTQHRFGSDGPTIEIPGGMVDPGEAPLEAARRELMEETGYRADTWVPLGAVAPNPAFQDNLCHHFLALGAAKDGEQQLDHGEDILVATMALGEMVEAIRRGTVTHSLVITAVSRVTDLTTTR